MTYLYLKDFEEISSRALLTSLSFKAMRTLCSYAYFANFSSTSA